MSAQNTTSDAINITYETTSILHISQFLIAGTNEEVIIDCSSGPVPDPQSGGLQVPVHSRIAMSWSSAQRLVNSLTQAIANQKKQAGQAGTPQVTGQNVPGSAASLPKFETTSV